MELTQQELGEIINILSQVQLIHKDSKRVNLIIEKLQSYVITPKPEAVKINLVEGEVVK